MTDGEPRVWGPADWAGVVFLALVAVFVIAPLALCTGTTALTLIMGAAVGGA